MKTRLATFLPLLSCVLATKPNTNAHRLGAYSGLMLATALLPGIGQAAGKQVHQLRVSGAVTTETWLFLTTNA